MILATKERKRLASIEGKRVFELIRDCFNRGLFTLQEIANFLNNDGHRTRRGRIFRPNTIKRAIDRSRNQQNKTSST